MGSYILFKNINEEDTNKLLNFIDSVYKDCGFGPKREDAVGICTTEFTQQYAYLSEDMCTKENIYTSWILRRKEYVAVDDFINGVKVEMEEYEKYYSNL